MEKINWQNGAILLVGIWLMVALFVLNITPPEDGSLSTVTWNFVLLGVATALMALAIIFSYNIWEVWITMALGLWTVVSPWVLGFEDQSTLKMNAMVCGILIFAAALSLVLWPRAKNVL